MASDDTVRFDTRLTGQMRRYHTWPITGNQTIAEHCWNLLRIYFSVVDKDEMDQNMVYHMVFHDIGETATGDAPYPFKSEHPDLKKQLDFIEHKSQMAQLAYWNAFRQTLLSEEDLVLFKHIELIEMAEFGMDQVCFGNSHGLIIADRCLKAVFEQKPCSRLAEYVIKRIKLFFQQARLHSQVTFTKSQETWWNVEQWELAHGGE